ncbi:hypothetical protein LNP25_19865 [Klebsiella variicola subsp. variicola]|nr:hypothetical protein [Klebsiella variicola subsp. variicola]
MRIAGRFNSTLAQTLATARQRIADTLDGKPVAAETLRLALSLQFCGASTTIFPGMTVSLFPTARSEKRSTTGWHDC